MAKYMFSESANLLCKVSGNKYEVINGGWTGTRDGDNFKIPGQKDKTIIPDWVEVDPTTWTREKQYQWYFRR